MRRFAKMIPQEISLTQEGANRRVIATYKSKKKPQSAAPSSAGTPVEKARDPMDIKEAIENTPEEIVAGLLAVTKSATANGKSYTPQAASVAKAIGRMVAPFSDELSLSDLVAIGKAAGLGGDDAEPTAKSVGKGDPDEDDTEAEGGDLGRGMKPKKMDFDADDENDQDGDEDDEQDPEDADDDDDAAEDDEPDEGPEPKANKVKKAVSSENVALKAKKDDTEDHAKADSKQPADEDEEVEDKIKPANAKAWGQPKGTKAKGETVAKSATLGSEEQYDEIRKSLQRQKEENIQLREAIAKTRMDLDEERGFRALESIKKSVKADYAHLNVDVDSLAPVLKSLKESPDGSMYEQLTATLKAADAQVQAAQAAGGIFRAVGKSSSRSAAAGAGATWSDKIEARVDEEFKKNAKGRVKAQVYDQFIETDEGRDMLANHRVETAQTRGF